MSQKQKKSRRKNHAVSIKSSCIAAFLRLVKIEKSFWETMWLGLLFNLQLFPPYSWWTSCTLCPLEGSPPPSCSPPPPGCSTSGQLLLDFRWRPSRWPLLRSRQSLALQIKNIFVSPNQTVVLQKKACTHGQEGRRKGGGCTPPEGQKQIPSPVPQKRVPITKKSLIYSTLYPLVWLFYFSSFELKSCSSLQKTEKLIVYLAASN